MEHTYYNSNQCYNETAVDNMNLLKKDLSRFKTKTPEEQAVQLHKIHNGDYSELNDFLCENMGLCIYFARKYVAFVEPMWEIGDLVQESFIGLRTAALKYDPDNESGAAFSTYASFWIKQAIRRFIDNNIDTIRIPVHMKESYRKMKYGIGKGMNIKDACDAAGMTPNDYYRVSAVTSIASYNQRVTSTDGISEDDELCNFIKSDTPIPEETCVSDATLSDYYDIIKEKLNLREFEIVSRRLGLFGFSAETLDSIGQEMGVTRERIRQIENKAYGKLKVPFAHYNNMHIIRDGNEVTYEL